MMLVNDSESKHSPTSIITGIIPLLDYYNSSVGNFHLCSQDFILSTQSEAFLWKHKLCHMAPLVGLHISSFHPPHKPCRWTPDKKSPPWPLLSSPAVLSHSPHPCLADFPAVLQTDQLAAASGPLNMLFPHIALKILLPPFSSLYPNVTFSIILNQSRIFNYSLSYFLSIEFSTF